MKTALWIAAAVAALVLLWVFRKAAVSAVWWTLKTPFVLSGKGVSWCWKRRWSLSHRTARFVLFAAAVAVPAVMLFPEFFGMTKLAGIWSVFRFIFALAWFVPCWTKGEPLKILGIEFLGLLWRSTGSGPQFLFRPLGIPFERVFRVAPEENFSKSFKMDIEVRKGNDRDFIPIKVVYNGSIRPGNLVNWLKLPEGQRFEAIQNWISSLITFAAHEMATSVDEVYAKMKDIGNRVTEDFAKADMNGFTLPEYLGNDIHKIGLADVDMPEDLKNVVNEKKKQEELLAARKVEFKSVEQRAKKAIKAGVDPKEAFQFVQVHDGKRTATINEYKFTLDNDVTKVLGGLVDKFKGKS